MERSWKFPPLADVVQGHFESSPDFGEENPIEIEDAVKLLLEADQYSLADYTFWDEDGTNNIVDKWWAHFGK
jgi:hypothetical protein